MPEPVTRTMPPTTISKKVASEAANASHLKRLR
jgi:hypothetical protein